MDSPPMFSHSQLRSSPNPEYNPEHLSRIRYARPLGMRKSTIELSHEVGHKKVCSEMKTLLILYICSSF